MVVTKLVEVTSKGTEWARTSRSRSIGSLDDVNDTSSPSSPASSSPARPRQEILATATTTANSGGTTAAPTTANTTAGAHADPSSPSTTPPPKAESSTDTSTPPRRRTLSSSLRSSLGYLTGSGGVPEFDSDASHDFEENQPDAGGTNNNTWYESAAESTYASIVAGVVSSFLYADSTTNNNHNNNSHHGGGNNHLGGLLSTPGSSQQQQQNNYGCDDSTARSGSTANRRSSQLPRNLNSDDLAMVLFQNPYNSVRGRRHSLHAASSLSAVRSLLTVLPQTNNNNQNAQQQQQQHYHPQLPTIADSVGSGRRSTSTTEGGGGGHPWESPTSIKLDPYGTDCGDYGDGEGADVTETDDYERPFNHPYYRHPYSPNQIRAHNLSSSETASQIAEGTLRALRDLALDDAVQLHRALRFWTERWERPLLSWLEAGPPVWFTPTGYNHQFIGKKVAQIQAVLARRCASIGELQQHLLRAGWQRGVAQWGVLGQGEQWAAVAGFDGSVLNDENDKVNNNEYRGDAPVRHPVDHGISIPASSSSTPRVLRRRSSTQDSAAANVMVRKKCGGGIFVDDPAFLTEWSLEAIALVRRQLKRAARGAVPLPYEENWVEDEYSVHDADDNTADHEDDDQERWILETAEKEDEDVALLPVWVSEVGGTTTTRADLAASEGTDTSGLVVSDLPLMVDEVSELLYKMEDIIMLQRRRRLEQLKPPSWSRQHWYVLVGAAPPVSYILFKMIFSGQGKNAVRSVVQGVRTFFRERVTGPCVAIANEIWKGRESFSDREARMEAIESLKKMIKSWLDDTFLDMTDAQKQEIAEAMDVTLVEQQKVESMKTFFEINNVVRMSFIEMQYMKKELLNAISAIDEMMSANDMTTNVAAITPVAMLAYLGVRVFKFFYYFTLKLGKSREETYGSFRNVLTDIERLLVMRDDPPNPPVSRNSSRGNQLEEGAPEATTALANNNQPPVLGADDLGMMMLLIHELRSILWQDSRRFPSETTRSVLEDLSELAGERGAVSVRQQLQIISRMARTYSFLQSTGHDFRAYSGFR